MPYMIPLEESKKELSKAERRIPFEEFDLKLQTIQLKQFFIGWLHYFFMIAEVIPIVVPTLIVTAGAYFRRSVRLDPELNQQGVDCNPANLENLGKVQLCLMENSGVLTEPKMTLSKVYVDETVWNIDEDHSHACEVEDNHVLEKVVD
jgi:magnesium-transporting ATPase (P-type)